LRIGGGEDLVGLLVQHQMIVAKVRARHVPVEVLGLQVERQHVRQEDVERTGDVAHRIGLEIGAGLQRRGPQCLGVSNVHGASPFENELKRG
jgi:hypothetical protein